MTRPAHKPPASKRIQGFQNSTKKPVKGRQNKKDSKMEEKTGEEEPASVCDLSAEDQLTRCKELVDEMWSKKNEAFCWPFYDPVSTSDYLQIIQKPIDLSIIKSKLVNGEYSTVKEFKEDIELLLRNCYEYNDEKHPVVKKASKLKTFFDKRMTEMGLSQHTIDVQNLQRDLEHNSAENATVPVVGDSVEVGESPEDAKQKGDTGSAGKTGAKKRSTTEKEDSSVPPTKKPLMDPEEEEPLATERSASKGGTKAPAIKAARKNSPEEKGGTKAPNISGKAPVKNADRENAADGDSADDAEDESEYEAATARIKKTTKTTARSSKDKQIKSSATGKKSSSATSTKPQESHSESKKTKSKRNTKIITSEDFVALTDGRDSEEEEDEVNATKMLTEIKKANRAKANREKANGEKANGEKPNGEKPNGEKPNGEKPNGKKPNGKKVNGEKPNGEKPNGEKPNGEKPNGEKVNGEKPNGEKPNGEKPNGKKVNGEKANGETKPQESHSERKKRKRISSKVVVPSTDESDAEEVETVPQESHSESKKRKRNTPKITSKDFIALTESDSEEEEPEVNASKFLTGRKNANVKKKGEKEKGEKKKGEKEKGEKATTSEQPPENTYQPYGYTNVNDVYDVEKLRVELSKDTNRDLESRIEEALLLYGLDMRKCSSGLELANLEYIMKTIGSDPMMVFSGLNTATAFKMGGAEAVVCKESSHKSPVVLWRWVIGQKGINKSGGFDVALKPLIEMEEKLIAHQRKAFDEEFEAKEEKKKKSYTKSPANSGSGPSKTARSTPKKKSSQEDGTRESSAATEGIHDTPATPTKSETSEDGKKKHPAKNDQSTPPFSPGKDDQEKSKVPVFNEQKFRNIIQGGTPEGMMSAMYNAENKSFFMNYDEASSLVNLLYGSSAGGSSNRTAFCNALLPLFSAREARSMKAGTGSQVLSGVSLQIFAVAQPLVYLDFIMKDLRDPAGLQDRITLSAVQPVDLSLEELHNNVHQLKKVDFDPMVYLTIVEDMSKEDTAKVESASEESDTDSSSSESPGSENKWHFDQEAKEAIYEIDEKMRQMQSAEGTGKMRGQNAKNRDKLYRESAVNAQKRIAIKCMEAIKTLGTDESVDKTKIIIREDVLKAAYIIHFSHYIFLQFSAAAEELQSTRKGGSQAKVNKGPGGFVGELMEWKKELADHRETFEKVVLVYEAERDEVEYDKIPFNTLLRMGPKKPFIKASSARKINDKDALLFFLRYMSYNGLGSVYFGKKKDKEDSSTYSKEVFNRIMFKPVTDPHDMSEDVEKKFQFLQIACPDFKPFA